MQQQHPGIPCTTKTPQTALTRQIKEEIATKGVGVVRKVRHNKEETIEGRKFITSFEICTGQYNRAMLRCAFRVWGRPISPHISTHGHATPPPPSTGRCSHNQHLSLIHI